MRFRLKLVAGSVETQLKHLPPYSYASADHKMTIPWYRDSVSVGLVFVPSIWLVVSVIARQARRSPLTSGADALAALMSFDAAVILAPADFSKLSARADVVAGLVPSHFVLLGFGFVAWFAATMLIEPAMDRSRTRNGGWYSASAYLYGLASWASCWVLAYLHVQNFRGNWL